jgi:hypothetical protein
LLDIPGQRCTIVHEFPPRSDPMNTEDGPLVGVVLGQAASPKEANLIAETHSRCPYCASFSSTKNSAMGIYTLPPDMRWWLERIDENPRERLGFDTA